MKQKEMLDEINLVKGCLRNDERAVDELYRRFAAKMFGICLRYAGNRMEAEDLLHDGFIKALNNLENFRFEGSFEGWLRQIMVNTSINFYRKRSYANKKVGDIEDITETEKYDTDILSSL
ncbi:MAG: sigma-70 family RNA polymerase sigma factor, partial [Bacteroidia bacterium]|nr:sigma-70 family RNA polymerase sigma factor [Bacteroidia bacterium]